MQSMQQRILDRIEATITQHREPRRPSLRYEPVIQKQHANTGSIFAMADLTTQVTVTYNFQDHNCAIGFTGTGVEKAQAAGKIKDHPPLYRLQMFAGGPRVDFLNLVYTDGERMGEMVKMLRLLLAS